MGKRRAWDNEAGDAVFVERPDGGRDIIREWNGEKHVYSTRPPGITDDDATPPEPDDDD